MFPLFFAGVVVVYLFWKTSLTEEVQVSGEKAIITIPNGAGWEQVKDSVYSNLEVRNKKLFELVAVLKDYPSLIKPGKYIFRENLSYIKFINILRAGEQTPVMVTFNNIRTIYDLAGKVGRQIEADSAQIADFLSNQANYSKDGFIKENIIAVFIPDSYEFYWNTTAEGFYRRMLREYNRFWNDERKRKAESLGLSPIEVSILASIVDDEVAKPEEKPRIAGVYINRLRRGMPLQACPTIKYALNDFTITRILDKYLEVESPYNTYKYKGFPPGPIGCATKEGIDAVLNAEKHDYLYFAAKADFSGYHNFSKTLAEHNRYAAQYQRELNKRKIYR
ncbi:MAG TPA: endolytic transglycosylase MltG [Bacteroidales bacterium]|nr:endolytic transglycosylase MltG [Bacteroidales bacterium]HOM40239.1 endolytic transglycosylase MltG [Bacteroidales bacterium]